MYAADAIFGLMFYVSASSYGHVEMVSLVHQATLFPGQAWLSG